MFVFCLFLQMYRFLLAFALSYKNLKYNLNSKILSGLFISFSNKKPIELLSQKRKTGGHRETRREGEAKSESDMQ